MPSRRHHAKTTTGCTTCKLRHVKCDETRPICNKCRRRGSQCYYTRGAAQHETPFLPKQDPIHSFLPPTTTTRTTITATATSTILTFDALDLALMHRYCTTTSINLLPSSRAPHFWQLVVPVKFNTHVVVTHGMLALAAVDLAASCTIDIDKLGEVPTYRTRGFYHQQAMLSPFQEMLKREPEDADERTVIFLVAVMLIVLGFGSIQSMSGEASVEDLLDVFALFRGPRVLWESREDSRMEMVQVLGGDEKMLVEIAEDCNSPENHFPDLDPAQLDEICLEALTLLRTTWTTVKARPEDIRRMALFPALMSEGFRAQLHDHRDHALAILRHYASVLRMYSNCWWVGSCPEILTNAVDAAPRL